MQTLFLQKHTRQNGFSLMETIVATAILAVIVSGVMSLVYQAATAGRFQKDRIIATYLAGDAIEFIRADRDSFWIQSTAGSMDAWASQGGGIFQACSNGCRIDTRIGAASWSPCSGGSCRLTRNETSGLYGHQTGGGWNNTRFSRVVNLTRNDLNDDGATDSVSIDVSVSWNRSGGSESSVEFSEVMYDWYNL